ncbi:hypothetical protein V1477_009287 [Vespula maculifrons]|uniref:Uncharacterized protein n=1 Tax=Vespula maculifrons TaxID=7453 RepID=A0ABD2C9E7_VESMC
MSPVGDEIDHLVSYFLDIIQLSDNFKQRVSHSTIEDTKKNKEPEPVSPGCSQAINKKIPGDRHAICNAE